MKAKEPGQGGAGHLFTAAKEDHQRLPDNGDLPSNLGANLGGE